MMSRFDAQRGLRRLPACPSFVWQLDAVIDRVSKHVIQRCIKPRENVAIDRNVLADDLKLCILAECARDITDSARKRCGHIGERPHPTRKHFVIELRRGFFTAANCVLNGQEMRENATSAAVKNTSRGREQ